MSALLMSEHWMQSASGREGGAVSRRRKRGARAGTKPGDAEGVGRPEPCPPLENRSMSTSEIAPQSATVPEERRQEFLPTLFGRSPLIVAENDVYGMMDRLSPLDYGGGFWDFYEHEGRPLFLAPKS